MTSNLQLIETAPKTGCHTVCWEAPSRRMVWYMVRSPLGSFFGDARANRR
jgi:hypothetical protein